MTDLLLSYDTMDTSLQLVGPQISEEVCNNGYTLYKRRYYILFIYSLLSFNQSLFWLTFSPIQEYAQDYYNIDAAEVYLLLNWGPIIFIPALPFTFYLCDLPGGLRKVVLASSSFCAIGMLLRVVVNLIHPLFPYSIYFLHAAQIFNAMSGPLVMSTVSQVSLIWFGVNERTKATAIAVFSNYLGSSFGFLLMPALVTKPSEVPNILYTHAVMAVVAFLLTVSYFPEYPPTPPSRAAELQLQSLQSNAVASDSLDITLPKRPSLKSALFLVASHFWTCVTHPSFLMLSLSGGVLNGVFGTWTAIFSQILPFTTTQTGWLGFVCQIASIVGGILMGAVADTKSFSHRHKFLLVTSMCATVLCFVWFLLSISTWLFPKPPFPSSFWPIALSLTCCGFTLGLSNPVYYELGAEITFPVPEAYSAGVITLWNNLGSLVFVFCAALINPDTLATLMNILMFLTVIISTIILLPVQENYLRRAKDESLSLNSPNSEDAYPKKYP